MGVMEVWGEKNWELGLNVSQVEEYQQNIRDLSVYWNQYQEL